MSLGIAVSLPRSVSVSISTTTPGNRAQSDGGVGSTAVDVKTPDGFKRKTRFKRENILSAQPPYTVDRPTALTCRLAG